MGWTEAKGGNVIRKLSQWFPGSTRKPSKEDAKKRLKLLLIHDQIELSPAELNEMKSEIIGVIGKYLSVDVPASHFRLDRQESKVTLISSVPVSKPLDERIENLTS